MNPVKGARIEKPVQFPTSFFWGAATSAHQVEGGNRLNDWWEWEEKQILKTPSLAACEHYERFESDFDLAKNLGHNAHRFSIEWSRLEPEKNRWNEKEFAHYHAVLDALIKRKIEPIVTLHHFTLPAWLARDGGFENPRIVDYFGYYARKVVEAFGSKVKYWVTINEPMVFLFKGYLVGEWPPGLRSSRRALKALRHLILAHIRAYQAIHHYAQAHHDVKKPIVGFAQHVARFSPCSPGAWRDRLSAWLRQFFSNHLILKALHSGFLFFPGIYCEPLPMRRSFDFLGLNYYTRHFVHFKNFEFPGILGDECNVEHHKTAGPRNDMGWEIYPKGLFDLLLEMKQYQVPIMILENGICTGDDATRTEFIRRHLLEIAHAMEKHVPVAGYLYWSLLDNFEWEHGFRPRFGIIEVDYQTQERRIRGSAQYFSEICKTAIILP
ncbi:MAG: glycoside hydrolase family 1 protein [Candidatus Omnitrophica bacterium]|nr:glycoside hydrolase family 1 protein [Candidatus Omnitrophota bacterium]